MKQLPNVFYVFYPERFFILKKHSRSLTRRGKPQSHTRQQLALHNRNGYVPVVSGLHFLLKIKRRVSLVKMYVVRWMKRFQRRSAVMILISGILALTPSLSLAFPHTPQLGFWRNHELLVFYKPSCAHCKTFGQMLSQMVKKMNIPVVNFTLEKRNDPNYQNTARLFPLYQRALLDMARQFSNPPIVILLNALLQGQANQLPFVFLVSSTGKAMLVSSGSMNEVQWLKALLNTMQTMAIDEGNRYAN